ncbi:MAG: hypothetical protein O3C57_00005, partial [Verrucomicrobia bacterium]|nr:hypothetical protein [Verrucomicrobiota bacterium]
DFRPGIPERLDRAWREARFYENVPTLQVLSILFKMQYGQAFQNAILLIPAHIQKRFARTVLPTNHEYINFQQQSLVFTSLQYDESLSISARGSGTNPRPELRSPLGA